MGLVNAQPHTTAYGEIATLLLVMCEEQGIPTNLVRTVPGGFEVPDVISDALKPAPPASWSEPLPIVGVVWNAEHQQYVLTEAERARLVDEIANPVAGVVEAAGREEIRAWAQNNGYEPAPVGKLKQVVIEAFRVAHPDRATAD